MHMRIVIKNLTDEQSEGLIAKLKAMEHPDARILNFPLDIEVFDEDEADEQVVGNTTALLDDDDVQEEMAAPTPPEPTIEGMVERALHRAGYGVD